IGNLLQFERAFHGHGIIVAAPQEQEVAAILELFRDAPDLVVEFEDFLDLLGDFGEGFADFHAFVRRGAAHAAQKEGDEGEYGNLGSESFGGGHAYFRSGVQVHATVGFACDAAAHHIAYAQHGGALLLGLPQGGQSVGGFAGLGDDENQSLVRDDGVSVAELRSVFHFHRNAGKFLDKIFADFGRVERGAAGRDD